MIFLNSSTLLQLDRLQREHTVIIFVEMAPGKELDELQYYNKEKQDDNVET